MSRRKKSVRAIAVLLAAVLLLAGAGTVYAAGNRAGVGQGAGISWTIGSMADQVANILGISRQELAVERQTGKSLADIAAARSVTKTELTAKILETRQTALKKALEDKKITQAQYDTCVQNMKQNIEKSITRTTVGPNNGQGRGQGKGQGKGQGQRGQMGGGCGQQCRFTTSG